MGIYSGGAFSPTTEANLKTGDHQLKFVKKFPKELNSVIWSNMIIDLCKRVNLTPHNIDHYFITQININSIKETLDILGVGMDKTTTIMHNYGYTGSACIPMAYHEAIKKNKIKEGDTVLFIGSGGGLAFAGTIFKL
jgi:3-oxoacyl-[acyl-carrier-protein] synthase-3